MHFVGNVLILLVGVDSQCLFYYVSELTKTLHIFFCMYQLLHYYIINREKESNPITIIKATP